MQVLRNDLNAVRVADSDSNLTLNVNKTDISSDLLASYLDYFGSALNMFTPQIQSQVTADQIIELEARKTNLEAEVSAIGAEISSLQA